MTKVQNEYSPMSVKLSAEQTRWPRAIATRSEAAYGATVNMKRSVAVWPEPSSANNLYSVLRDGDTWKQYETAGCSASTGGSMRTDFAP